jgi:hypothetical protein
MSSTDPRSQGDDGEISGRYRAGSFRRTSEPWQRFVLSWRATDPGVVVLCSKAYSHEGARQPEVGRRNAIHRIEVKVI